MIRTTTPHINRVGLGIGLMSVALIAFQLALMQLFSITQWYHFAHLIISLALLGFGASGTFLAFFRKGLVRNFTTVYPVLLLLCSLTMAVSPLVIQSEAFRFDTYLLFKDSRHLVRLALTCLFLLLPFFLGALAIGLSFVQYGTGIGRLYFANLLGSGLGGGLALALMWLSPTAGIPALLAILPFFGGFWLPASSRLRIVFWVSLLVLLVMNADAPPLVRSEYKSIEKTLLLPDARVIREHQSPYGLLEVVGSPALRYAPGLSLSYRGNIPARPGVFNNGDGVGVLLPRTDSILRYTTQALPYQIQSLERALILRSGTGEQISLALSFGVQQIDAVEPNRGLIALLEEDSTGNFQHDSTIRIMPLEPRSFLRSSRVFYDLIQLPEIGSFWGSSGLNALEQRYDLTREAMDELWLRLTPDGLLSVSCWMDYPIRSPLRMLATFSDLLEGEGLQKKDHLVVIRSWSTLTLVAKKSPFTSQELDRIRTFCAEQYYDPLILPGDGNFKRDDYNQLDDPWFFQAVDQLMTDSVESLYRQYAFRIRPATDNLPHFFQFLRLSSLPRLKTLFGNQTIPFMELGYVVLWLTFVLLVAASLIFILLPLVPSSFKLQGKGKLFFYFAGIGLGYLFVEMVFIQQFKLFLGLPIYAASGVISLLLLSSGIGSYFSSRIVSKSRHLMIISFCIAILILGYALLLAPVLRGLNSLSMPMKVGMMVLLVCIPGLLMGLPFPLGLSKVSSQQPTAVPWAWAVNGCASVVSTSLAVLISVEAGFIWVMVGAAVAYAVAGFSQKT
ncbi:hypothetical protein [Sunxiuqinia sp. sy24]|uniref:hypothetical protein n=1 Tax=Sunxiuqinia sp. sy24 TaxID=3461495 RepID=UPI00404614AE